MPSSDRCQRKRNIQSKNVFIEPMIRILDYEEKSGADHRKYPRDLQRANWQDQNRLSVQS